MRHRLIASTCVLFLISVHLLFVQSNGRKLSRVADDLVGELQAIAKLSDLLRLHGFRSQETMQLLQPDDPDLLEILNTRKDYTLSEEELIRKKVASFFKLNTTAIGEKLQLLLRAHENMKHMYAANKNVIRSRNRTSQDIGVDCGRHRARYCSVCARKRTHSRKDCGGECVMSASGECVLKTATTAVKNDPQENWPAEGTFKKYFVEDVKRWLHQRDTSRCVRRKVLNGNCRRYTETNLGFDPFLGWVHSVRECQQLCANHSSGACEFFHLYKNGACFWRGGDMKEECTSSHGSGFLGPANCSGPLRGSIENHDVVFVGGPHFSGTSIVNKLLGQSDHASIMHDTGVAEDEGQHLQHVYPSATRCGGMAFGCNHDAHLTETSALLTPEATESILDSWGPHWNISKRILVEKSPPNVAHLRFLQRLFDRANRTFFVMTTRHPIGLLHGRIPTLGMSTKSLETRYKRVTAARLVKLLVSKLQCGLALHRTLLRDSFLTRNLRIYQIEHFMDNIHAGIQDISEFLSVDDIQENVVIGGVEPHKVKGNKTLLTPREHFLLHYPGHPSIIKLEAEHCPQSCNGFSCDEILAMAKSDPTLELGSNRLSCGFFERFFDCDCTNCACVATREETEKEKKAKLSEIKSKKIHDHHFHRSQQQSVNAEHVTTVPSFMLNDVHAEYGDMHHASRKLYLWGNRKQVRLDPQLTWNWMPAWLAILKDLRTPTSIQPHDIVTAVNMTELSRWVWAQVFIHEAQLLEDYEELLG